MQETIEALRQAREIIKNSDNWVRGYMAIDREDRPTSVADPNAVAFCALGAIYRVALSGKADTLKAQILLNRVARALGARDITDFNDTSTHYEVMNLFNTVIAVLEAVEENRANQ
jgi:hypothetical protein